MHPQTQKTVCLLVQRPGQGVWLSPVRLFLVCFKLSFFSVWLVLCLAFLSVLAIPPKTLP